MQFNKIIRGSKREQNDTESLFAVLDAAFLCHVSFVHNGQAMCIPTAFSRKDDDIYIHGSAKNFMLNEILNDQSVCVVVTLLDGLVLAKTLFDTSMNYRSVVLFGKAEMVSDVQEKVEGLKRITESIIPGRIHEVPLGNEQQLKATLVIKIKIESASVKVRNGGPMGDENIMDEVWSGEIPLVLKAMPPIQDMKFGKEIAVCDSVNQFLLNNQ